MSGVEVGDGVGVGVTVGVGVAVGVSVKVGVGVAVGVLLAVCVAVNAGIISVAVSSGEGVLLAETTDGVPVQAASIRLNNTTLYRIDHEGFILPLELKFDRVFCMPDLTS